MRAALALLLIIAACRTPPVEVEPARLTLLEVEALLGKPGVFLFDANPKDFYEHGHLPGARWVQFDAVDARVLPPDRSARLIFYCANELCTASHAAARSALAQGYPNTFLMPEGFIGWKKSGRPLIRPDGGVTGVR